MDIALAEVLRAPTRTAFRVLAVGGAVSLTLLFEGFRLGMYRQMATPAAALPAPLVAVEEGAKHFVGVRSNLPQSARAAVEAVRGVRAAYPLVALPVIFNHDGRRTPVQLMAHDAAGAPRLAAGRANAEPHEIVLDERLARLHGLHVGDRIEILYRGLRVVGLSTGTDVSFAPLAFVTYDELIDLYLESDVPGAMGGAPLLSFLLIELRRARPQSPRVVGPLGSTTPSTVQWGGPSLFWRGTSLTVLAHADHESAAARFRACSTVVNHRRAP
jgi:putative ABC transport system permease protein